MGKEIEKYCISCPVCQTTKPRNHLIPGLLHSLPLPWIPWTSISMDFVGPFPRADGYDYLWVIVCRLTSMVHLIPVRTTNTASDLAAIYMREVVRLHGLPESIVSDRDPKFTSKFRRELHRLMGSRLLMSTAFHPQTESSLQKLGNERLTSSILSESWSTSGTQRLDRKCLSRPKNGPTQSKVRINCKQLY